MFGDGFHELSSDIFFFLGISIHFFLLFDDGIVLCFNFIGNIGDFLLFKLFHLGIEFFLLGLNGGLHGLYSFIKGSYKSKISINIVGDGSQSFNILLETRHNAYHLINYYKNSNEYEMIYRWKINVGSMFFHNIFVG